MTESELPEEYEDDDFEDEEEEELIGLCMVLLRQPSLDYAVLTNELRKEFGDGIEIDSELDEEEQSLSSQFEGAEMLFAIVDSPVPEQEAEYAADGYFMWEDGAKEVAQHQSHVIINCFGGTSVLHRMLLTTRAARAVLSAADCIGVYWVNGMIVNSSSLFLEMAEDLSTETLPLSLWMRFQPMSGEGELISLYTVGLEQFGILEIEIENSSQEPEVMLEFVFDIAHYLVTEDCIISDGDTIGSTDEQRFLVTHKPSLVEPERIAHRIELP